MAWQQWYIIGLHFVFVCVTGQDIPGVLFSAEESPMVTEANVNLSFCVNVFGSLSTPARVTLITEEDTAKANQDFEPVNMNITLLPGTNKKCYSVVLLDDELVEGSETFTVGLIDFVGNIRALGATSITVTIVPDTENTDTIGVAFNSSSYIALENSGAVNVCAQIQYGGIDSEKTVGVRVGVGFIFNTAVTGVDLVAVTTPEFVFRPGSMVNDTSCIEITLLDDRRIEDTEEITLFLQDSEAVTLFNEGDETQLLITDDEGVRVLLVPIEKGYLQEANPGDSADTINVCITAEADSGSILGRTVPVSFELSDNSEADDSDLHTGSNGTIELLELNELKCISIKVINDDVREANETVIISILPQNPNDETTEGTLSFTIVDDGDTNCPTLIDPPNGRVILDDRSEGSVAVYECDIGYSLDGDNRRRCGSDGKWDGNLAQCMLDCGEPPTIVNGAIVSSGTTQGSLTKYSCQGRRVLVGQTDLECLENGQWSEGPPFCLAICDNLSNPDNGEVEVNNIPLEGSRAVYSCNTGYYLVGNEERLCDSDSQWSGTQPLCLSENSTLCSSLSDPVNGRVESNGVTATYTCHNDLELVGNNQRICNTTAGEWLGQIPICSSGTVVMSVSLLSISLILSMLV